jgi:hypothetical protein
MMIHIQKNYHHKEKREHKKKNNDTSKITTKVIAAGMTIASLLMIAMLSSTAIPPASATPPLQVTRQDYMYGSGGEVRIVIEFNKGVDISSVVWGQTLIISGPGGRDPATVSVLSSTVHGTQPTRIEIVVPGWECLDFSGKLLGAVVRDTDGGLLDGDNDGISGDNYYFNHYSPPVCATLKQP